jgi:cell shape-determining protein MreC
MRLRKRHAWGAILIVLFILPLLKPAGVDRVEGPIGGIFAWTADVLPSPRGPAAESPSDGEDPRVKRLEEERSTLLDHLLRTRQQVADLGALKSALERSELDRMPKAVLASVLRAHDPVPLRRSILIGRGTADGVRIGHAVVMGGVYLGRVRVAREDSALVQLLTDPRSRLEVFVRTSKDLMLRGYAQRKGSKDGVDLLEVEFVRLRGDVGYIRPGAPVFTSNFDERVPAHLLIGTVTEVSDPDRDRMPKLIVRPSMDLDRSTEVVVLVPQAHSAATPR